MKTSTIPAILLSMACMASVHATPSFQYPSFGSYGEISIANANFITQTIDQRMSNLRSGSELLESLAPVAALGKDGKGIQLPQVSGEKRWSTFLTGGFTFAELDATGWQQDSKFASSSLLAGIDAKISDTFTSGCFLTYTHTDADLDARGSNANIDSYGAGVYGSYRDGGFYGNGVLAYSRNIYESDRVASFSSAVADGRTSGNQYVVNIDGGYDCLVANGLTVGPLAGLQYVHLDVNSFSESNAGVANLSVNDQGVDSLRSRLGLRLQYRKELSSNWTAATEARAAWQHEFANNGRLIAGMWGGDSYGYRTSGPERNAVLAGLGINATYCKALTAFVDYDVQSSERYLEQIVKGGVKWSF